MKNILVTGANRGLGLEFVRQMAKGYFPETVNVIGTCRDPTKAQELEKIKSCSKVNVHILKLDVADEKDVKGLGSAVKGLLGPGEDLTLLLNNAGYGPGIPLLETSWKDMESMYTTNAIAPAKISESLLPSLCASAKKSSASGMSCNKAAIVSISSALAVFAQPLPTGKLWDHSRKFRVYAASKAALNMVMRGLAAETAPSGVLVVLLDPGWVNTDMGGDMAPLSPEQAISAMLKTMGTFTEKNHGCFIDLYGKPQDW